MKNKAHLVLGLITSLGMIACGKSGSDRNSDQVDPFVADTGLSANVEGNFQGSANAVIDDDQRQQIEQELDRIREQIVQTQDQLKNMEGGQDPQMNAQKEELEKRVFDLKQEYADKWDPLLKDAHSRLLKEVVGDASGQDVQAATQKIDQRQQELEKRLNELKQQETQLNEQMAQAMSKFEQTSQQAMEAEGQIRARADQIRQNPSPSAEDTQQLQLIEGYLQDSDRLRQLDVQIREEIGRMKTAREDLVKAESEISEKAARKMELMAQLEQAGQAGGAANQGLQNELRQLKSEMVDSELRRLDLESGREGMDQDSSRLMDERKQLSSRVTEARSQIQVEGNFAQVGQQLDTEAQDVMRLDDQFRQWQEDYTSTLVDSDHLKAARIFLEHNGLEAQAGSSGKTAGVNDQQQKVPVTQGGASPAQQAPVAESQQPMPPTPAAGEQPATTGGQAAPAGGQAAPVGSDVGTAGAPSPAPAGGEAPTTETPAPAGGQAAPAPAGGQAAPAPAGGQAAPAPAGGQAAPAPAGGQAAPAPAGGQAAPAPAGGQTAPAGSDVGTAGAPSPTPAGGEAPTAGTPSPAAGTATPAPGGEATTPGTPAAGTPAPTAGTPAGGETATAGTAASGSAPTVPGQTPSTEGQSPENQPVDPAVGGGQAAPEGGQPAPVTGATPPVQPIAEGDEEGAGSTAAPAAS